MLGQRKFRRFRRHFRGYRGESAAETTTVNEGYDYSGIDCDGYSFRVLNIDEQFGCYIRADIGEQTGEMLDDSVYTRNRKAEEDMGIKIEEIIIGGGSVWSTGQIGLCEAFINNIMAGGRLLRRGDTYDILQAFGHHRRLRA